MWNCVTFVKINLSCLPASHKAIIGVHFFVIGWYEPLFFFSSWCPNYNHPMKDVNEKCRERITYMRITYINTFCNRLIITCWSWVLIMSIAAEMTFPFSCSSSRQRVSSFKRMIKCWLMFLGSSFKGDDQMNVLRVFPAKQLFLPSPSLSFSVFIHYSVQLPLHSAMSLWVPWWHLASTFPHQWIYSFISPYAVMTQAVDPWTFNLRLAWKSNPLLSQQPFSFVQLALTAKKELWSVSISPFFYSVSL